MSKAFHSAAFVLTVALASGAAFAAAGPPGHSHETFSAGEPGDPKKPAQNRPHQYA